MRFSILITAVLAIGVVSEVVAAQQSEKQNIRSRAYTGGFVMRPAQGKSIQFANEQTMVPADILQAAAEEMSRAVGLNIVVSAPTVPNTNPALLRDEKVAAVVVVRAEKDATATMLVAPEDAWAVLDVGRLAKDGAGKDVLAERVRRELWRTTAIMLGASDSTFRPCLLEPVHSLSDLDSLKAKVVCPEPLGSIQRNAKKLGCGSPVYTTYRVACQEGWAPPPTNDLQKAIWERARAEKERGPSNPLQIKP